MIKLAALLLALSSAVALADKDFDTADGGTHDCAEDPIVNINQGTGAFTITGECKEINVNGDKLKVTVANTAELNLNGTSNTVAVTEVGAIQINGTKNKVTWKKAKSGKRPSVATNGKGNAISKVK